MMAVGAVGQHFINFPCADSKHKIAVDLKHGCVAMMASVGAVGQHFIKVSWAGNVRNAKSDGGRSSGSGK